MRSGSKKVVKIAKSKKPTKIAKKPGKVKKAGLASGPKNSAVKKMPVSKKSGPKVQWELSQRNNIIPF